MKGIDELKYTIECIFETQKASDTTKKLMLSFHESLIYQLNRLNLSWNAHTHKIGIAYLYKNKVFIWVNVNQKFVSIKFFTGTSRIPGLIEANWNYHGDNKGSETLRIKDDFSICQAVFFALEAYKIATDWVS
jgi:hypothetical protein